MSDIFAPFFVIFVEITPSKKKYVMKYNEFCYFHTNETKITKSGMEITSPKEKYVMKYNESSNFFFLNGLHWILF